jgi:carboxypeptidase T
MFHSKKIYIDSIIQYYMGAISITPIKTIVSFILICLLLATSLGAGFAVSQTTFNPVPQGTTGAYYTYDEMTTLLQQLAQNHSDIMQLTPQGVTYQNRAIWSIKLSDNVEEDENDEPAVLLLGAHHGNEKPSFQVLIYFIQYMVETYSKPNTDDDQDGMLNEDPIDGVDNDHDGLIDEDPSEDRVRDIFNSTEIYIIPMVNPDGVEVDTRKNCAPNYGRFGLQPEITSYGDDLNRNYAYRWFLYYLLPFSYHLLYYSSDSGFNYRGEHPFSENETLAVKQLVEAHPNIRASLSYHSYGEFILFPWTHTSRRTPDEALFRSIGAGICAIDGYELYIGEREYLIPRYTGSIGTSENWLYGEHGILSYTIELCKERAPTDPAVINAYCLKHVGVNLFIAEQAAGIHTKIRVPPL